MTTFMPFSPADIARAVEEGREAERERITQAIKNEMEAEKCDCGLLCEGWRNGMEYALEIIKGETE